jgi:hypothetical protein
VRTGVPAARTGLRARRARPADREPQDAADDRNEHDDEDPPSARELPGRVLTAEAVRDRCDDQRQMCEDQEDERADHDPIMPVRRARDNNASGGYP